MNFPFPLPFLLDGATATNLAEAGMPSGVCVEQWILDHPEPFLRLQREFLAAGAHAVYTPTFGANRACLKEYGLEEKVVSMNRRLTELSRRAAQPFGALVGGDLCPTGLFVPPFGQADFDDLYDIYREQIRALDKAGVDFLIIETQTSLSDMRAATLAARTTNLPVFVTLTVDQRGHTLTGGTLLPALITLQAMGVDAVGLNCSFGPAHMVEWLEDVLPYAEVPLIAKPSAGVPMWDAAGNPETLSPHAFAQEMRTLIRAGARIVGGCCGTTPAHIRALAETLKETPPPKIPEHPDSYAAAIESEAFFLGDDLVFSRPIPCSGSLDEALIDLEDEQVSAALVSVTSVDDARILGEHSSMTRLPIAVHAEQRAVLDAALRYFQGRLIIDSECSIPDAVLETLAAKYGAILY